jgi:L-fucose isomerase-like protein
LQLNIVSLLSPTHDKKRVEKEYEPYLEKFRENFQINILQGEEIAEKTKNNGLTVVFVKTGGTEYIFKKLYASLPQPIYLISTSLYNSLAASLEILSWLKYQGGRGRVIHGNPDEVVSEIKELSHIDAARKKISNSVLGVIGEPSDWLIASDIDPERVKEMWGTSIKSIAMNEFYRFYEDSSEDEAEKVSGLFYKQALDMKESSQKDLINAARVYLALKKLIAEYNLTAFTIRCFDLVNRLNTTGCLALSLLNNEGIIAGCEGDVPATFTMMFSYDLTEKLSFMANPVTINNNIAVFAHCTIATKLTKEYIIRSHFETGIGVGIQGKLEQGPVTVLKIGGKNLDKRVAMRGELLENLNSNTACRTQIRIRLDSGTDYFFKNPIGNHHVIIPGDYLDIIEKYFDIMFTDNNLN